MNENDLAHKITDRPHIAVDTDGWLLMVNLTTADISDSAGAQEIVSAVRRRWPWLKHLFGDAAYDRTKLLDAAAYRDFTVEIIRRSDNVSGFKVLPRRWVVERTFGLVPTFAQVIHADARKNSWPRAGSTASLNKRGRRRTAFSRRLTDPLLDGCLRR